MWLKNLLLGVVLLSLSLESCRAERPASHREPWWKSAVIYQLYPRSFFDSDGDGIGDLNGIREHLDYLQTMGVDAVWINPCYPSPLIDTGYDVTDFEAIDPQYGTLADFDRLVHEARGRGIRILMDFVPDHTSDQHPWFQTSARSRSNAKKDWYLWADGKGSSPPNNWQSFDPATKSAWQFEPRRGQYYYHMFDRHQPNLNWRNPQVQRAMLNAMRFWLRRGVAGFRLDAVNYMYVDDRLRDNPSAAPDDFNATAHGRYTWNLPEYHRTMRRIRRMIDGFVGDRVLIGETDVQRMEEIVSMYGRDRDELQLPMNFNLFWSNFSAASYQRELTAWEGQKAGWPLLFFSNHDFPRSYSRLGDGSHDAAIARLMAVMLLTVRGTPIIYYGEELGMGNGDLDVIRSAREHAGVLRQPPFDARDVARTPMQWDASANAGFTRGTPWLPVEATADSVNVEEESREPGSLLRLYRRLIELRRANRALKLGSYVPLNSSDEAGGSASTVLSYMRRDTQSKQTVVVVLNLSASIHTVRLANGTQLYSASRLDPVLSEDVGPVDAEPASTLRLGPYGFLIAKLRDERNGTMALAGSALHVRRR